MILQIILWGTGAFICGALPFSIWIGRYWLQTDIRQYGDKNPGATNVFRAGGALPFIVALMLDISKGAVPVGLAYQIFGLRGWEIVPIALAPPLGHAFSPFLAWRGGKSIATAFGVWIGLTLWTIPLIAVVPVILLVLLITPAGWAVMGALMVVLVTLIAWIRDPVLLAVWATHAMLLIWTHQDDLRKWPSLRRKKNGP